jgi:hypothetical protein
MGELAIAIAHEVNQPLSAAGTYSRLVTEALGSEELSDPRIIATARKATAQVERAADVIRRLRALVRLGRSELSPTNVELVVQESLDLIRLVLERGDITIAVYADKYLPPVMADRVQVEQVLFNLLRNSAEALASAAPAKRRITIRASRVSAQLAEISVSDTGPGFPKDVIGKAPTLFSSQKADGLVSPARDALAMMAMPQKFGWSSRRMRRSPPITLYGAIRAGAADHYRENATFTKLCVRRLAGPHSREVVVAREVAAANTPQDRSCAAQAKQRITGRDFHRCNCRGAIPNVRLPGKGRQSPPARRAPDALDQRRRHHHHDRLRLAHL